MLSLKYLVEEWSLVADISNHFFYLHINTITTTLYLALDSARSLDNYFHQHVCQVPSMDPPPHLLRGLKAGLNTQFI
jgi:hypothetical protein